MGYFKKVIKLLKNEKKLDEKLQGEIMSTNKIYKYSIELLLTTIISNNLQNELIRKNDDFSSNVYDNQNLRVLLEILNENSINMNDILHNLAGIDSRTEDEEAGFGFGSLSSNNSTLALGRKRKSTKTRGRKKKKSSSNTSNSNRNRNHFNSRFAYPQGESPTSLGNKGKNNKKQQAKKSSRTRRNAKKKV